MKIRNHKLNLRVALLIGIAGVMFVGCPKSAYADVSLTITGDAAWPISTQYSGITYTTGDKWNITNNSDGNENFEIKVTGDGTWAARTTDDNNNVIDEFVLREASDLGEPGTLITNTNRDLITGVAYGAPPYGLDLWFKAPPDSTSGTENLTVVVTATNWTIPCAGWSPDGINCWYLAEPGQSCDTVCATHGGCKAHINDPGCHCAKHYITVYQCSGTGSSPTAAPFCTLPDGYGRTFCYYALSGTLAGCGAGCSGRRSCVCNQ